MALHARSALVVLTLALVSACSLDWSHEANDAESPQEVDASTLEAGMLEAGALDASGSQIDGSDGGDADVDGSAVGEDASEDSGFTASTPFLVSVAPADGATGVAEGASLVFTFGQPMNTAATEAAFQSAEITGTFSWANLNTVMTVHPSAPLAYATGTAPASTTARVYSYALSGAQDAHGHELAAVSGSFKTLRRVTTAFAVSGSPRQANTGNVTSSYCYDDGPNTVGASTSADRFGVLILQFDINALPGNAQVEAASLSVHQLSSEGSPFNVAGLGSLVLQHVYLGTSYPYSAVSSGTLRGLGVVSTSTASAVRTRDVVAAVRDDVQNRVPRGNLSQYRITFENVYLPMPAIRAYVAFACRSSAAGSPERLDVTYLIP